MQQRIAIIGNSGSGKTYLAAKLGGLYNFPIVNLDDLFWASSSYTTKRSKDEVYALLNQWRDVTSWIIEGVYGELIAYVFDDIEMLIWLDMDWVTCRERILARDKANRGQSEVDLGSLLDYANAYWTRDNERSHLGHASLYKQFLGVKYHLASSEAVDQFLQQQAQCLLN
ncbi:MAG: hypothetical protein AAF708_02740 [Deinococcota bacterium]